VVWGDGEIKGAAGRGKFLPCELPAAARPSGRFPSDFDPTTGRLVIPTQA
jgi:hypothetical protein